MIMSFWCIFEKIVILQVAKSRIRKVEFIGTLQLVLQLGFANCVLLIGPKDFGVKKQTFGISLARTYFEKKTGA